MQTSFQFILLAKASLLDNPKVGGEVGEDNYGFFSGRGYKVIWQQI